MLLISGMLCIFIFCCDKKNYSEVDVPYVVMVVNESSVMLQGDEKVENRRRGSSEQPVETLVIRQVRT